jgi:hypothetical protein
MASTSTLLLTLAVVMALVWAASVFDSYTGGGDAPLAVVRQQTWNQYELRRREFETRWPVGGKHFRSRRADTPQTQAAARPRQSPQTPNRPRHAREPQEGRVTESDPSRAAIPTLSAAIAKALHPQPSLNVSTSLAETISSLYCTDTGRVIASSSTPLIFEQRFLREGEGALPIQRCERFLGNTWLRTFADSRREVCSPGDAAPLQSPPPPSGGGLLPPSAPRGRSRISRWDAATGSRLFWMRNVALDFSRTSNSRDDRDFKPGFVQAACRDEQGASGLDFYKEQTDAGMRGFELLRDAPGGVSGCDEWVDTPTLVAQHDDIGNTYHMLVDFWRVWMSIALLQQPACVPEFEPRIGYHADGPADRPRHPLQETVCPAPSGASTYFDWGATRAGSQPPPPPPACPPGQVRVHGIDPASMQLLNMDARVMCNVVSPLGVALEGPELDCVGPYFPQYERWFGKGVVRARDFGKRRVCFSALGWAANNPESHIWSYFGSQSECDGPSPLFRQYIDFNMQRWGLTDVAPAVLRAGTAATCGTRGTEVAVEHPLPVRSSSAALNSTDVPTAGRPTQPPCRPYVRLLYVVRKRKPFNPNPVVARTIGNEGEFVAMLEGIGKGVLGNISVVGTGQPPMPPAAASAGDSVGSLDVDIDVDAADFTGMPYEEQLRRVRAAHVMIGMHGAGLIHVLHMAGSDAGGGPTGIVELLNRDNDERGIEHLASYGGHKYWRWHNKDIANESHGGTVITIAEVAPILREAIRWNVLGRQKQSTSGGL